MKLNKIHKFSRLLKKYESEFEVVLPNKDEGVERNEYDDLGNLIIRDTLVPVKVLGSIMPLSYREVYQSGGAITTSDRILRISTVNSPSFMLSLPHKTKIIHKGKTFFTEGVADFLDFADFCRYTLKGSDIVD